MTSDVVTVDMKDGRTIRRTRHMKRYVFVGLAVAILGGCGFPSEHQPSPPASRVVVTSEPRGRTICFLPEGCLINGHRYAAGEQTWPEDR
jgi:hypothetical protein